MHNNYVALLIKQFVFTRLVESNYKQLEHSTEDINFIFWPVRPEAGNREKHQGKYGKYPKKLWKQVKYEET